MKPPFLRDIAPPVEAQELQPMPAMPHKKKRSWFLPIFLVLLIGGCLLTWINRHAWGIDSIISSSSQPEHVPDPVKYAEKKDQLQQERLLLSSKYRSATTTQEKNEVLDEASLLLEESMPEMMRCWLGHPWDFNGTAETPGTGKIACGYYVSTLMRDSGFKVNRIYLAQQASQTIINTFTRDKMIRGGGMDYDRYVDAILNDPKYQGINIVGLDKHVAFIVIRDGKMRFIHSSGGSPKCVVDEAKHQAAALKYSKYRVIGNISNNKPLLRKWLMAETFTTGGSR